MNVKIGSAPDSWGVWFPDDPKQTPWCRFLDEIVEAGYELDKRGLKVSGSFALDHIEQPEAWLRLERQVLCLGELLAAVGAEYLVLIDEGYTDVSGDFTTTPHLDESAWKRLIDATDTVAGIVHDRFGLR